MDREELAKVTRFEVIDHTSRPEHLSDAPQAYWIDHGRVLAKYGVAVELSLQDDGRTLKVFISDRPAAARRSLGLDV